MYQDYKIAVVVPAYNEEKLIGEVIHGMPHFVDRIYLVDDASTDRTSEVAIQSVNCNRQRLLLLKHKVNCGVGAAIVTGYRQALLEQMDISVVMAGDNQMDPAQLPALLNPLVRKRAEYSKGCRMSCAEHLAGMSYWRRFGNWLLRWLTRIACGNFKLMDPQNGYTAITRWALKKLDLKQIYPGYGYCNDILVKLCAQNIKLCEVPMPSRYGNEKSKIRYLHYIPSVSWLLLRDFNGRIREKYR